MKMTENLKKATQHYVILQVERCFRLQIKHTSVLKGSVPGYPMIFSVICTSRKVATARASVADIRP